MPINNTNPNSYGGSFNYDGRTGLGYGQLGNNPSSGLGSTWNMGDALSSPKGEWDVEEYSDCKECGCRIEIDCDCINDLEIDIELKAPTSGVQFNRDSGSGKSSRNPNSFVGLANTSAHLGLSASHNRAGSVLKEFISETIKDIILNEAKPSMGVSINVRSKGLGNPYRSSKASVSGGNKGLGPRPIGIDHDGYGQSGTQDMPPYVKKGKATTDGAEVVYGSDIDTEWDEDLSTGDSLMIALGFEEDSTASFKKHAGKNKYYS